MEGKGVGTLGTVGASEGVDAANRPGAGIARDNTKRGDAMNQTRQKVIRLEFVAVGNWFVYLKCGHSQRHYTYTSRPIKTVVCDRCSVEANRRRKEVAND